MPIEQAVTCPACLPHQISKLRAEASQTYCVGPTGMKGPHIWTDRGELNQALAYGKASFPMFYQGPPAAPAATPEAVASAVIVINPPTRKLLEELAKQPILGESDVKSILFDAVKTSEQLEKEVRQLRAMTKSMRGSLQSRPEALAMGPDQVMLTIPEWAVESVQSMAESCGKTPAEWCAEEFGNFLENYCGAPAGNGGR